MNQTFIFFLFAVWFGQSVGNIVNICDGFNKFFHKSNPTKLNSPPKEHKDELHELKVKELLLAQTYKTGYDEKSSELADSYSTTPINILQEKIDSAYKRVKCGYIYNAKMHLLLTSNLLEQKNEAFLRELHNLDDILYDEEAIWMIHTLMPINNIDMNEVWLLYAYSKSVRMFFENIKYFYDSPMIVRSEIKGMHEYLLDYLEEFTDKHCDKDNAFDIKSEHCTIAVELRNARKYTNESFSSILPVIITNKKLLRKNIESNVVKGMCIDIGNLKNKPSFNYNDLFFRDKFVDIDIIINLIKVFTNNYPIWNTSQQHLKSLEKNARDFSLNGLKSLGIYQRYVIDLLKAIILYITWKHLLYLDKLHEIETKENVYNFILEYEIHLTEFVEFIGIEKDYFFKTLIKNFNSKKIMVDFKTNASNIISFIKTELVVISGRLQLQIKEPSNLDTNTCSKSFDKTKKFTIENLNISYYSDKYYAKNVNRTPILDTIFSIDVLNGYMQYLFTNKFPFIIIHSFNKMTEDLTYKLEEDKSLQI